MRSKGRGKVDVKAGEDPPPLPGGDPVTPPFACKLKANVRGQGVVTLYLCFLCPRAVASLYPDAGRLTLSVVRLGLVLTERPLFLEWMPREQALAYLQARVEEGWAPFNGTGKIPKPLPAPKCNLVEPESYVGKLLEGWEDQQTPERAQMPVG